MFFYSESPRAASNPVDVWKMDAVKAYMRHFENYLFLDFILNNGTDAEKRQSSVEMAICERKMKFWERHPNFIADAVKVKKEKLLKDWRSGKR